MKIKFDHKKKIITITKKLAKSAESFDSDDYNAIAKLNKDYPNYTIEERIVDSSNKQTHRGLTFERIEMYISAQPNKTELFTEYNKIKEHFEEEIKKEIRKKETVGDKIIRVSKKEQGKIKKEYLLKRYTQTKAWFIDKFPEYHETPEYKLIITETKEDENITPDTSTNAQGNKAADTTNEGEKGKDAKK